MTPGPKAASNAPKQIRAVSKPPKLYPVACEGNSVIDWSKKQDIMLAMRVEQIPHPIVAQPIQIRGGNNFEVTVTGIWTKIYIICQSTD